VALLHTLLGLQRTGLRFKLIEKTHDESLGIFVCPILTMHSNVALGA
jgi:hypothetical protein